MLRIFIVLEFSFSDEISVLICRVFVGNINKDFNKAFKKLRSVSSLLSPKDVNEVTTFVCGNMFGNATRSTFKKEIGASEGLLLYLI